MTLETLLLIIKAPSLKRERINRQLPEIVKTGVERAIEQNEEVAIEWINQRLEALGVNSIEV